MKKLLFLLLTIFFYSQAFSAQLPVTVGTGGSKASLDTNFGNTQSNFTEIYGELSALPVTPATTAVNDVQVGNGSGSWIKKTLEEFWGILSTGIDGGKTIIGGTAVTDTLKIQGTSGNGNATAIAIQDLVGNNGGSVARTVLNNGNTGFGDIAPDAKVSVVGSATDKPTLKIKSVSGQTAPLADFQDSSGTSKAYISNTGTILAGSFTTYGTVYSYIYKGVSELGTIKLNSPAGSGITFLTGSTSNNQTLRATISEANGYLGLGLAAGVVPTNPISLSGNASRTIWMERHTTANTAGNSLNVSAGGATSGATDKDGGGLILSPGVSTGTGKTSTTINRYSKASSTGTSDNTAYQAMIIPSVFVATAEGNLDLFEITLPTLYSAGGKIDYQIMAGDGTDVQNYSASVRYTAVNKSGTYYTSIVDDSAPASTGSLGAITPTWSIVTGTDKITIRCSVACSSITANDIKIYFTINNGSRQVITLL
jgi:hypothetical protein